MHATGSSSPFKVEVSHDNDGTPFEQFNRVVQYKQGENEGLTLGPLLTPAQAEVWAFALNMISQGYTLVGRHPLGSYEEQYNGPTEGVRA